MTESRLASFHSGHHAHHIACYTLRLPVRIRHVILMFGVVNACLFSGLLPLWEGFDEAFHFAYVETLWQTHRLPVLGLTLVPSDVSRSYVVLLGASRKRAEARRIGPATPRFGEQRQAQLRSSSSAPRLYYSRVVGLAIVEGSNHNSCIDTSPFLRSVRDRPDLFWRDRDVSHAGGARSVCKRDAVHNLLFGNALCHDRSCRERLACCRAQRFIPCLPCELCHETGSTICVAHRSMARGGATYEGLLPGFRSAGPCNCGDTDLAQPHAS